ncbi:SGNH/GDSL hydrolase family protein [Intrasporangium sp. DVR]|uniref:SGNH/GDSL hydrolase family protein n=1 Tax=Intrasporangium sp. DVR TaxID=3127867 RepID=UPI00313A7407
MVRFVALGDSLTEGVGDPHPLSPNGLRGWADRFAKHLSTLDPTTEYANLALRSKRAHEVLTEQVGAALALQPDLVSLWAGGNDVLRPLLDPHSVLTPVDVAVEKLSSAGAQVVVITGFELTGSPALGLLRRRVLALNDGLREIAHGHAAALVDVSDPRPWSDRRLWAPDRVHPSPLGHARLAQAVATACRMPLGALPADPLPAWAAGSEPSGIRPGWRDEALWWREHAIPHVRRWVTGASAREDVVPKWAHWVRPARDFAW